MNDRAKLQELNIQHPEEVELMSQIFECQKLLSEIRVDFEGVCNDENKLAFARSKYDVKVAHPEPEKLPVDQNKTEGALLVELETSEKLKGASLGLQNLKNPDTD